MKLKELFQGIEFELLKGDINTEITGIAYDSRKIGPGYLFVCIAGFKTDGHSFIDQAVKNGAAAILAEKQEKLSDTVTYVLTPDSRKALSILSSNIYHKPSHKMKVVGVTGTNGKTTTTHLIKAVLEQAGKKTGIIGTLYAQIDDIQKDLGHTTPEALEIEEFFSLSQEKAAEYMIMEVSSHALDLNRVDMIDFNAAVFTNLTQDHLDYHVNMNNYKDSKCLLFRMIPREPGNFSIINADDPYAEDFIEAAGSSIYTYGIEKEADVRASSFQIDLKGSSFTVEYNGEKMDVRMKLIGLFSIYNALAAIAFALVEGLSPALIKAALEEVEGVPGRFEQVNCGQNFTVVVDYAHTPDGLQNILQTARQIVGNRLITVFGCGGDRDRTKRPLMGEIAARYSDFCVVTSDNPRSEEPDRIIAEIIPGMESVANSRYAIIPDRREAIRHAIYLAKEGDLVIIAGKGHETYQLVKDQVLEFDDRKVAAEFLKGKDI